MLMLLFTKKARQSDLDRVDRVLIELLKLITNLDMRVKKLIETSDRQAETIDKLGAMLDMDWNDDKGEWKKNQALLNGRPGVD